MKQDMEPYKELTECPACGADQPFRPTFGYANGVTPHLVWCCSWCSYQYVTATKSLNTRAQA